MPYAPSQRLVRIYQRSCTRPFLSCLRYTVHLLRNQSHPPLPPSQPVPNTFAFPLPPSLPPSLLFPVCIFEELWQLQLPGPTSPSPPIRCRPILCFCAKYLQLQLPGLLTDTPWPPLAMLQWATYQYVRGPTALCTVITLSWPSVRGCVQNLGNFNCRPTS